jgi:hypothetical protein
MSRISFRDNGEDHNFWQNYTDLMSGFLIVFIIASLVAYGSYKVYVDLYHSKGITEANINDIVVNAEMYRKIRAFQKAQETIQRKYFVYNKEHRRFECTVDILFSPNDATIPYNCVRDLEDAGKEIQDIITKFREKTNIEFREETKTNISFKVVVEGRAAKPHGVNPSREVYNRAARLSYERARNVVRFWNDRGILTNVNEGNDELLISGSGYEGKGRHTGLGKDGEDKNKTIIIQIIPDITY